ncbi:hypothetical protein RHMOL_Rhmol05G0008800 [Rhododendron molle]|uniref:Uncharacterized protein n=1 Tax=Rhododendron molle TaxID=49168 RepID=A0ACC0NK39_RHOML|nr:hypothetical protein RHMOL_Rhmol05G0008800 [Rhododendron molle]
MPLQILNWQGREGAVQLCSFEAVENKAFMCDECGIHEHSSVPTIWCEFPQGHKDKLTYHKECFITILRKATKYKNVASWVEDEFLATKLKNIKAGNKEDTKVTTVTLSIPMIEQLSEAEPVIQQLSDTKAENQSLRQLGFSLEDLGASDESAMKGIIFSPFVVLMLITLDMSITEKKRLTCFYYYGGERRVLPNGTFDYVGGVSGAMLIEDDMSNEELLSKISSCLNISLDNKLIFHNTKRDKTKYLCVRGDNGVKMLLYLNEDEVDVFVDEDPTHTSTRNIILTVSHLNVCGMSNNTTMSNTEKKRLACFCYSNGTRTVLPDGTFKYNGGVSKAMRIEDDMSYKELLSKIRSCLQIQKSYMSVYYNSNRDKTKYLRLDEDNGAEMLFHLNEEEVDVFVE